MDILLPWLIQQIVGSIYHVLVIAQWSEGWEPSVIASLTLDSGSGHGKSGQGLEALWRIESYFIR